MVERASGAKKRKYMRKAASYVLGMPDTSLSGRSTLTARRVRKSKLPVLAESLGVLGNIVINLRRKRVNVCECEKSCLPRGPHCQHCELTDTTTMRTTSVTGDREHAMSCRHLSRWQSAGARPRGMSLDAVYM